LTICTPGNLSSITAQPKAGKSGFIDAMIAASLVRPGASADTLGLASTNKDGLAVVHFDTEQSHRDHYDLVRRAMRRAGVIAMPPWLLSYCLTGMSAKQAWSTVREGIEAAFQQFGGIHSVLVDGLADLVVNVNDPEECNAFVASLHALAISRDCPIVGVIHFNPGTEKSRGHLGSQMERKSETNLHLDKKGEVTFVWSQRQRRAPISKDDAPSFQWDDAAGMHVSVRTVSDGGDKAEGLRALRDDVFGNRDSMRYSDLVSAVKTHQKASDRTAQRTIKKMDALGVIQKLKSTLWCKRN
jgi:hypothetical protein